MTLPVCQGHSSEATIDSTPSRPSRGEQEQEAENQELHRRERQIFQNAREEYEHLMEQIQQTQRDNEAANYRGNYVEQVHVNHLLTAMLSRPPLEGAKPPTFTGSETEDVEDWLLKFHQSARFNNWDDE